MSKKNNQKKEVHILGKPASFYKGNKNFWASMILLVIMVLSIAGFALSGGSVGSSSNSNSNSMPSEIPFQQFQDQESGQIFWGAIRNSEQFIYMNITGFDNRTDLINLAAEIKQHTYINIYKDSSFNSAEADYVLDKAFRGIQIGTQKLTNETCDSNTLYLTTNQNFTGDCMIFHPEVGQEYNDANILVYFLIQ